MGKLTGTLPLIVTVICLLLLSTGAYAHQPRLILDYRAQPVAVDNPLISYAFYGTLDGAPEAYVIQSSEPFRLYVNLLAPYTGQAESSELGFKITKDGKEIAAFDNYSNWTRWYEEYGGDWYLYGPTYDDNVSAGEYVIEVYSDSNSEKYTLATGYEESFGPLEILNTMAVLPLMKAIFWGNYTLVIIYLAVIALLVWAVLFLKKRLRKKKK